MHVEQILHSSQPHDLISYYILVGSYIPLNFTRYDKPNVDVTGVERAAARIQQISHAKKRL